MRLVLILLSFFIIQFAHADEVQKLEKLFSENSNGWSDVTRDDYKYLYYTMPSLAGKNVERRVFEKDGVFAEVQISLDSQLGVSLYKSFHPDEKHLHNNLISADMQLKKPEKFYDDLMLQKDYGNYKGFAFNYAFIWKPSFLEGKWDDNFEIKSTMFTVLDSKGNSIGVAGNSSFNLALALELLDGFPLNKFINAIEK